MVKAFQTFLKNYPTKFYPKGSIIVYQGDAPDHTFVVKDGFVKGYTITAQGDENVIGFDRSLDIFPVSCIFTKEKEAKFFHEAFTDCNVHVVPTNDYLDFLAQHPELMYQLCNYFIDRYLDYQSRVHGLEQPKAADKVLYTLAHLVERFGKRIKVSCMKMTLPLTQQDFACFVGLTRETTGTQLKKLERLGVLKYRRQNYIVYTDKLQRLLAEK